MKVDVLDMKGKKVREIELPAKLFEAPVNVDLMHQAYVRQMANARLGTHDTKVRSEVRGGGRKPWKHVLAKMPPHSWLTPPTMLFFPVLMAHTSTMIPKL